MTNADMKTTGWVGWGIFAAIVLLIAGVFDTLYGIAALIGPDTTYFLTNVGIFSIEVQSWGWWHLISGVLLILTALALFTGATWARVVAIVLVSLNAIGQLTLITAQPWLSLIVLTLDVLVIYALTVHGKELKAYNNQ